MKKAFVLVATVLSFVVYIAPILTQAGTTGIPDPVFSPEPLTIASLTAPNVTPDIPAPLSILKMRITAYASVPEETDSTPFITANGTYVHNGIVATNILPFGTRIEIPALFGDKVFTVEDRMNIVFRNSVDIWMPSVAAARYFGQHLDVTVLVLPKSDEIAENN